MAARTFGELWRKVQLRVPGMPVSLVQEFAQDAYDDLAGKKHWAWLREEYLLTTLASRSIEVTFTNGSTAITSAAAFVASDAGRQIRLGGIGASGAPIYTINAFTDASNATITEAYAGTTTTDDATVHDRYLAMPADFRSFYNVTDLTIQRPIAWWISKERLDLFDPARVSSDSRFRVLASNQLSAVTSLSGRVCYEAWPAPTAAGTYVVQYFKRSDALSDDDELKGVLATKIEALIDGALARCARWPGTVDQKNPYFNLRLATEHEARYLQGARTLDVMDDDQYLESLQQIDLAKFGLAAVSADTTLMRQSDATLADYY